MEDKRLKTRVERLHQSTVKEKQRFSIRKLSVGAASVFLGTTFFLSTQNSAAHADTVNSNETNQAATNDVTQSNEEKLAEKSDMSVATSSKANSSAKADAVENKANSDQESKASTVSSDNTEIAPSKQETNQAPEQKVSDNQTAKSETSAQTAKTEKATNENHENVNNPTKEVAKDNSDGKNNQAESSANNEVANNAPKAEPKMFAAKSATTKQVQVTYNTDEGKTWESSLDLADGQTIQAAVQAKIDKDNAIQDKIDENTGVYVNQSPLLLQYSADQDPETDVDGTGKLKDQYEAWLAKKAKEFPLAGYTLGEIKQDNDNYIVNLIDPGYSKMIAVNDWETFKRQIEFKKYYGDGDTITFKQDEKIGYAVDSTSKTPDRPYLSIVYPGGAENPKNGTAASVPIEQVNSKTSTDPGAPKGDVNEIAWRYVSPRVYNPVTGQIQGMGSNGAFSNNSFPIQFDGAKVDAAVEDGSWTTTEGDVAKTGTAFGEVGTYGVTTRYGFVDGQKNTHNPPTVYITYYHNQPVEVTFEDITDANSPINLSNFNAPELTWQSSNNNFVTRQESDNDVDKLQLKTKDTYQGTGVKYSYQAGDYTKQGALTTDSHATNANSAINGLTTLNYQDVLNAYLANGYAFVSADDDNLSYDKDKVWTKDSTTTENDGHKLNVLHRVIKLVRTATKQTATQTVTRNINFVADRDGMPALADPIKQTVTYTSSEFYGDINGVPVAVKGEAKDADGNVMKDAHGNILYIVDGSQAAAPITWTAKDGDKFNEVVKPTESKNKITGQDTIEVADGDLKGDWTKFYTASESLVPAPTTINGEWNGYKQSGNDKTQYTAPDVPLVYYQKAHENSDTKTVKRVVHFKTVDGQTLLKDNPVESVTFSQNYYTDGNGNVVSVKTVKDSSGHNITVVKDVLTGKDAENAKAWKVSDGNADFTRVDVPEITDGLLPGDWIRVSAERNSENGPKVDEDIVPADEIQDTVENGANQEYTIYYAQKAQEHQDSKSVNRVVNFLTENTHEVLKDSTTETVSFNRHYFTALDKNGKEIFVNAKQLSDGTWVVDHSNTAKPVDDSWVVSGDPNFIQVDVPEITDGKIPGNWIRVNASKDKENGPDLINEIVPADKIQSTVENDANQEYTIYYAQQAFEHTANKSAKRIIHYVADKPEFPVLQDEKTQTINFTTTYYTTNEDGSGDLVAVKKAGLDKDGNIIYVVDYTKEAPKDKTWTVNNNASNQDVTITDGQASYNKQAQDIIFKDKSAGALAGTWTIEYASNNAPTDPHLDVDYAPEEAIPSTIPDGSVEHVYLVYTKDVDADITYWDITDGEDKAVKLGETDPDAQEHGKPGEDISFTKDPAERIKEYEKQGYVFVRTDFNNDKYGEEDSHFNVYLVHGAIQKHETKESVRKIHYVADEGKGLSVTKMPELQDITIDGSYYVDKVTKQNVIAKEITDANGNKVWVVAKYVDAPAVEWKTVSVKSVTGENGKYTFEAVTTPDTITLDKQEATKRGVNDGTWTHDSSLDLNNGERDVEVSNWDPNLTDGYLVYKQKTPTTPDEPTPNEPDKPNKPDTPDNPTPNEPDEPNKPDTPDNPTPNEPDEPNKPDTPDNPTPNEPDKPNKPDTPDNPTPNEPDKPNKPDTPDKPTEKKYHWTIEYVDEDGNKLIPDVKDPKDYPTGDTYNGSTSGYDKPTITVNGKTYELVPSKSKNTNGTFTDHDEHTVYVYKLKEDKPVNPTPEVPVTPENPNPSEPSIPSTPDTPTPEPSNPTPDKPVEPTTPTEPSTPDTPTPSQPSEPTTPTPDTPEPDAPSQVDEPSTPTQDDSTPKPSTPKKTSYRESNPSKYETVSANKKYREATAALHEDMDNLKKGTKTSYKSTAVPKSDKILPQTGEKSNTASEVAGIMTAALAGLVGLVGADRKKKRR